MLGIRGNLMQSSTVFCVNWLEIRYAVVLAYMPRKKNEYDDFSNTILLEGIADVHPRYAIDWLRNCWMLQMSDCHHFLRSYKQREQDPDLD